MTKPNKPQEQPQTQKPSEIQVDPALERIVEKDIKPNKEIRHE
jgi:hypothetical protein